MRYNINIPELSVTWPRNCFQLLYCSLNPLQIVKKPVVYIDASVHQIWSTSLIFSLVILRLTAKGLLELSGFFSKLVGGRLLESPEGIPSLVKSGWKLKKFYVQCWRRGPGEGSVLPAAPSEGRSGAAGASHSPPSSLPLLPCSQRPKIVQKKVQKHGSYGVLNCHTVFTVGATITKFGTHMDHGQTHVSRCSYQISLIWRIMVILQMLTTVSATQDVNHTHPVPVGIANLYSLRRPNSKFFERSVLYDMRYDIWCDGWYNIGYDIPYDKWWYMIWYMI